MLYNSIYAFPVNLPDVSDGTTWYFSNGATLQFLLRLDSRARLIAFLFSGRAAHSYNRAI